jgi:23S rRNA (uridine2552-2'-O)-methyltransferase
MPTDNDRRRVRVKTAKGRPVGSKLWLERQLNDPYVARRL